jgi:sugar/nucleoside kinase (ribokinase family)
MIGQENHRPRLVGVGAVFIDDIVLPNGQTYMAQLGGGVVHALMGAAIWGERPGINAIIGQGLPAEALARLEQNFDTAGLIPFDTPQMRAWQLFEEGGTRRELYRVSNIAPFISGAQPEQLPAAYQNSQGFYLLQGYEGICAWCKAVKGLVLWEPLQQMMMPDSREVIRTVLHTCAIHLISPNLAEAEAVYGNMPADELVTALFEDGAQSVALRMGEQGSLVADRNSGERWLIPAVPVRQVVDQTGAGNTYCGGLLWGLLNGKNLRDAGAAGAVAASFCIEGVGVVNTAAVNPSERDKRYAECIDSAVRL